MRNEEINQIAEANFARYPNPTTAVLQAREDVFKSVLERLLEESALGEYKDLLLEVAALESKFNAFHFLVRSSSDGLVLKSAAIEQLLVLYESCEHLCGFLVDMYDVAPASDYLKAHITKDDLITSAAMLQTEREAAHKDFVENMKFAFPESRLDTFRNTISFTMIAFLGEERYCRMMAEANDAFAILRAHPKYKQLIG